ncbi:MAG: RluA family pseudouridine synthase [Candidatus Liberibacter ctenarytainae]|uniref:Pseudouridine synthase n=1 Tax=Candidatus Liberibacter ctenarytainae TaxID=2020335 RepID=A0A937AF23_9HYPH|nr:RluA family pseudouridine synthase [Candidatus Liberibacter ctenarytainae]
MEHSFDSCNHIQLLIASDDATGRMDRWLTLNLKERFSRSYVKTLITNGSIQVNDVISTDPARKVFPRDNFLIILPQTQQLSICPENIALNILYEDDDIIVINKQANLVVHPAPGHWTGTLVNALLHHCRDNLSGINGVKRPGIVHRLDKDTTGVMVVAKNDIAHQQLAKQFADHGINLGLKRFYYALIWGIPSPDSGIINAPLGRCTSNRLRQSIKRIGDKKANRAVTHYQTIEKYNQNSNCAISLMRCRLETGRTHQIRVHMSYKGHPLIGDPLYGKGFKTKENIIHLAAKNAISSLGRQALHAYSLSFNHPRHNQEMCFEAPLPEDMINIITILDKK